MSDAIENKTTEQPISNNFCLIQGVAISAPSVSHSSHGITFYQFEMQTTRQSGINDTVTVIYPGNLPLPSPFEVGQRYRISGSIRSHRKNVPVHGNNHTTSLRIFIYANSIMTAMNDDSANMVRINGTLTQDPAFRMTPMGRNVCDLFVFVPRAMTPQISDYIPCIAWEKLAQACQTAHKGDRIQLTGRLQSRQYTKQVNGVAEERTAYELSVSAISFPQAVV